MLDRRAARDRYVAVRARTEALAAWLSPEDQLLQAFADASPTKWHRAHTTWFFEQFALSKRDDGDERAYLWNSYYDSVGPRHPRAERGLLSRPSCAEVGAWRAVVDDRIKAFIDHADDDAWRLVAPVLALGCHHEEQHQELILTDILAAFVLNPAGPRLRPALANPTTTTTTTTTTVRKPDIVCDGGLVEVGFAGGGFCFDNELPRHKVFVQPFTLAGDVVTVGDCRAFVDDGGYQRPSWWLAAGFAWVQQQRVTWPHRVRIDGGVWHGFGVDGWRVLGDDEPAAFLNFYEADALARFLGGRLPTEFEWELACGPLLSADAGFDVAALNDANSLRPRPAHGPGEVWEWTSSSYSAYPGFAVDPGALGEYNGKFMIGQQVLRGGSAFTPRGHARASYRNFWRVETRFQLSGVRVARDR